MRPLTRLAKVKLSERDLRIIAAYCGVPEATDEIVENYVNVAIRSCLEQDSCFMAKTERGRIRARLRQK